MEKKIIELSKEYGIPGKSTLTCLLHSDEPEMKKYVQNLDAMLVLPGGGYHYVAEREGEPIALQFFTRGYNAYILKYDVDETAVYPLHLTEAACAVDYIRKHATENRTNPDCISAVGFSAGGHLCANLANYWNRIPKDYIGEKKLDCKLFSAILGYPVISFPSHLGSFQQLLKRKDLTPEIVGDLALEKSVTDDNPPTFVFTTATDNNVDPMATVLYTASLLKHKIPVECHIYEKGPHGGATFDRVGYLEETIQNKPELTYDSQWLFQAHHFIQSQKNK